MKQKIVGIFVCILMIIPAALVPVTQAGCPCESEKSNIVEKRYDVVTDDYFDKKIVDSSQQDNAGKASITKDMDLTKGPPFYSFPPPGWTITTNEPETVIWDTNNWHGHYYNESHRYVARIYYMPIRQQDDSLISPSIDCSALTNVTFSFWSTYIHFSNTSYAEVRVSTDGGLTWLSVVNYTSSHYNVIQTIDISSLAAGQSNVKICFRYVDYDGYYWLIDDFTFSDIITEEFDEGFVACSFIYNITALIEDDPGISFISGCGNVSDNDYDKFISDLSYECGSKVIGIEDLSITFEGNTYYGDPKTDTFVTDKNAKYCAWVVSKPKFELHAASKSAENITHFFNYTIWAKGTQNPTQYFDYKIIATGEEDYYSEKNENVDNNPHKFETEAKAFKKAKNIPNSVQWSTKDPFKFIKATLISVQGKGDPEDLGVTVVPTSDSPQDSTVHKLQVHNRNLGFSKGKASVLYELIQAGNLTRTWTQMQNGSSDVNRSQGWKYIADYTGIDNSGLPGIVSKSPYINYDAKVIYQGKPNYRVHLSMRNETQLYAWTNYTEPWSSTNSSPGDIKKIDGVKEIGQHNVISPNNDTKFSAEIFVSNTGSSGPVLYTDRNGDGRVDCGQYFAWMDGATLDLPTDYKLLAAFNVTLPSAFIDSILDKDGNFSGWLGPYNSGATCIASHIWTNPNTYQIKVKAKDTYGNESSWSLILTVTIANHLPNTPSAPNPASGATNIDINADLSWTGGDPDSCDTVKYDVYFGTTSSPPKVSSNQSGTTYDPGTMNYLTTYYWKIVAWDNHGASKAGPVWHFTTKEVPNSPPNKPQKPSGETSGETGQEYTYTTSTTDPNNDQVYYNWSWGDGTYSGWLGPFNSGATATATYSWTEQGTYSIKVKAKDIHNAESVWSDPLPVTMPLSQPSSQQGNIKIKQLQNQQWILNIQQISQLLRIFQLAKFSY